jgi:ADP-ribose pyrophosphatase YjhB (NUDIX family)
MANFCQQCGHAMEVREIDGRSVPVCPACGFTAWANPVVATMALIETPGGLILGRRSIEPGYGLWCLPGGFVNEEEHPAEAAARECLEEIRAKVSIDRLLDVYHIIRGDGRGMVAIAYVASLEDGEAPSAGHEMLEVGLFAPDSLPELAFSSHRQAIADWISHPNGVGARPQAGRG